LEKGGLKTHLSKANKYNMDYALIMGSDELQMNKILVKDMHTSKQELVSFNEFENYILNLNKGI